MDDFGLIVGAGLGVLVVALLLIGKYYPGSGAEVLDWKPSRSIETEIELEQADVDQMLAAQNERRRRRGLPDRTEDEVRTEVADEFAEAKRRRDEYLAERARADDADL